MAHNKSQGDIEVSILGTVYVVRVGNNELAILEDEWKADGIGAVIERGLYTSSRDFNRFAQVALDRHQRGIDISIVRDLCDYKSEDGTRVLVTAIHEAINWALPKGRIVLLTDEEYETTMTARRAAVAAAVAARTKIASLSPSES